MRDCHVSAFGEGPPTEATLTDSGHYLSLPVARAAVLNLVADRFKDARERPAATQRKCMSQDLSEAIAILSLSQQFR